MGALTHAALLFAYAVIAAAVAFGLPDVDPTLEPTTAYALGAVVFIAAALAHEIIGHAALSESVETARRLSLEVMDELDDARDEIAQLKTGGGAEVSAEEMRLLRGLLQDIAPKAKSARRAAGEAAAEPAVRPVKPVEKPKPRKVLTTASDAEILDITREALVDNRVDLYLQPVVRLPQRKVRF